MSTPFLNFKNKFKVFRQLDSSDCGLACLQMISKYYGRFISLNQLQHIANKDKLGVNLLSLKKIAQTLCLNSKVVKMELAQLQDGIIPLPCILHWNQNHFVVIPPQKLTNIAVKGVKIADPAKGLVNISYSKFVLNWTNNTEQKGYGLILQPYSNFCRQTQKIQATNSSLINLYKYIKEEKVKISIIVVCVILEAIVALIFPFLTQKLFDTGIIPKNMDIINLVILSQFGIILLSLFAKILRGWQLLFLNSKIIRSLLSEYISRLMKLPASFFDSRKVGDITQRIADHDKIESFLTSGYFSSLLSALSLIIYIFILGHLHLPILGVFSIGSIIAIIWIISFLKRKKNLDYIRFELLAESQTSLIESIGGVLDIKVFDSNVFRINKWNLLQEKLYRTNIKILKTSQLQLMGSLFFSQTKNILISLLGGYAVVKGELSIGGLMSIIFIITQMNSPIENLLDFLLSSQEAKLSLERLNDSNTTNTEIEIFNKNNFGNKNTVENFRGDIILNNVAFSYFGNTKTRVLQNISTKLEFGKTTAIVGASGSGKSTLLKLLLKIYDPNSGSICIDGNDISLLNPDIWRQHCGVVLQGGFIFSDTVINNVTMSDTNVDRDKLNSALNLSLANEFVQNLPLMERTKIGDSGIELSTGQKQRILVARAIYKNPDYIFFDEATSSLDAKNEKILMKNILDHFKGKTVLIIAHRLSTVKNADQIIVLDRGEIEETGTHEQLITQKGKYYELVKNQLELGE
ncbi:MAG: peptidase domain-containing ABC transporter [Flavobacterium nitrogenifigens]|uniref:peptidase domain-containing ABC transporter n=1 Tax=Flavobacterium nitrogenifigens TaxID=1617283 RepID=UPI00280A3BDA|nr:peptidase domain-containing ABC transporter [Flavobacterium nitrogenifigens]MDQ8012682.1 peptidase domain-containing ABC transporter [Flavobacterium nitrogenifigens]